MSLPRLPSTCLLIFLAFAGRAEAQSFDRIVSFGDSLSDVGNVASQTFGISPGANYFNNRFSNGPLWIDALSSRLGLAASTNSRSGGYNYATGGTRSGTGFVTPVIFVSLPNAGQQVTNYLASRTPGVNELFTIWTGGNDFLDGQTNASIPANNVLTLVNRLVAAGARNISVSNLPPLGETPRFVNTADRATMNLRSGAFNSALATNLDTFAASNPSVNLFRVDVAGFFANVLSNPAAFGFTNVTGSALNNGTVVSNPDAYAFYDDVHPTRVAHALLGELALDTVTSRRFVGADVGADNWSTPANWSAARVPDGRAFVLLDSGGLRTTSARSIRRLELRAAGAWTIELSSAGGGRLTVAESASLAGEIRLDFAGSFVGLPGETFTLINAATLTGTPTLTNATGFAGLELVRLQSSTTLAVRLEATPGDANLDDAVDFDDLLVLAQNYETTAANWLAGDFTSDGAVGFDDLLALAQNYSVPALLQRDWERARALVPEPSAALALLALGGRRRRPDPRLRDHPRDGVAR